jgi:hypothetical protein
MPLLNFCLRTEQVTRLKQQSLIGLPKKIFRRVPISGLGARLNFIGQI